MKLHRPPAALTTYAGYYAFKWLTKKGSSSTRTSTPKVHTARKYSGSTYMTNDEVNRAAARSIAKFNEEQAARKPTTPAERLAAHSKAMADGTDSPYFN